MKIIKATADMIAEYYGHPMKRSAVVYAAIEDDVVHGLGGWYTDEARKVIFTDMDDEVRAHPKLLFKTCKMVIEEAMHRGVPLHSSPDLNIEASVRFLERLGFEQITKEVWLCQAQK